MKRQGASVLPMGMPMGPMIDMVFLLLVFFLVNARPQPQEKEMSLSLPGTVSQEVSVEIPEELHIVIASDGQVFLNDFPLDGKNTRDMPALKKVFTRFRESAIANQSSPFITLDVANDTSYQRIMDVLNACAEARIPSVSFAQNEEDL